jgi:hypothetical protein
VRSPADFSIPAVAEVLAKRAGVPVLDMIPAVRKGWGLVAESLPAAVAQSLAAELKAAGQDALAVPSNLLEELPACVSATKADFTPESFDLVAGLEGALAERLLWPRLALICAAALETRISTTVVEPRGGAQRAEQAVRLGLSLATGLPLMKKAEVQRVVETRDRRMFMDLVFTGPARRLRGRRRFDYWCWAAHGLQCGAHSALFSRSWSLAPRGPCVGGGRGCCLRAALPRTRFMNPMTTWGARSAGC